MYSYQNIISKLDEFFVTGEITDFLTTSQKKSLMITETEINILTSMMSCWVLPSGKIDADSVLSYAVNKLGRLTSQNILPKSQQKTIFLYAAKLLAIIEIVKYSNVIDINSPEFVTLINFYAVLDTFVRENNYQMPLSMHQCRINVITALEQIDREPLLDAEKQKHAENIVDQYIMFSHLFMPSKSKPYRIIAPCFNFEKLRINDILNNFIYIIDRIVLYNKQYFNYLTANGNKLLEYLVDKLLQQLLTLMASHPGKVSFNTNPILIDIYKKYMNKTQQQQESLINS